MKAVAAGLFAFLLATPALADVIVLNDPVEDYHFARGEFRNFRWEQVEAAKTGPSSYTLVIKKRLDGQTAEEAMASNEVWYTWTYAFDAANQGFEMGHNVTKALAADEHGDPFVWQITATATDGAHASAVQTFEMPFLVDTFRTGTFMIFTVTSEASSSIASYAGEGTLQWFSPDVDIPVRYSGLVLEERGSYHLMSAGEVLVDFEHVYPRTLSETQPGTAQVAVDQIRVRPEDPQVRGVFTWDVFPEFTLAAEANWFKSTGGSSMLGDVNLSPWSKEILGSFRVALDAESYVLFYQDGITPNLEFIFDEVGGPEFDLRLPQQRVFTGEGVTPESSSLRPLSSGELVLSVGQVDFDVDPTASPAALSDDPAWQGLVLRDLEVSFTKGSGSVFTGTTESAAVSGTVTVDANGTVGSLASSNLGIDGFVHGVAARLESIDLSLGAEGVEPGASLEGELRADFHGDEEPLPFSLALSDEGVSDTALVSGLEAEPVEFSSSTARLFSFTMNGLSAVVSESDKTVTLELDSNNRVEVRFLALGERVLIDGEEVVSGNELLDADSRELTVVARDGTEVTYALELTEPSRGGETDDGAANPPLPLTAPELVSPENGAELSGTSVTLFWEPQDASGQRVRHQVFLCTDPGVAGGECEEVRCSRTHTGAGLQVPVDPTLPRGLWWSLLVLSAGGACWLLRRPTRGARVAWAAVAAGGLTLACGSEAGEEGEAGNLTELPNDPSLFQCAVDDLQAGETYYWKVVVSADEEEEESDVWKFELKE